MSKQQIIIASNRLPFRIEKKEGGAVIKTSDGGLVSCLQGLIARRSQITWMGIADFKEEDFKRVEAEVDRLDYSVKPFYTNKKKYSKYYDGFSNNVIWPLFHYFPSYAEFVEEQYDAFRQVNMEFAEEICNCASQGAIVWVHDYHLMLVPGFIKDKRPDLQVGFFLHIPFPSYEILKAIPAAWRNEILESLTKSDIAGFHTREYASHFKKSITYFLNLTPEKDIVYNKGHNCLIRSYPVSVDFQKFNKAFDFLAVRKGRELIAEKYKGLKIIFSVDRLDYTKGVINRLQAYEQLLADHPEYLSKVIFILNVVPSREQMEKYAERKKMIEENIGRLNGLYGNVHWQPVIYQYRQLTFYQLLSFYTVADLPLITPLRDGMNLVAKEYVASRKDRKGVLILSEFAGAAEELKGAILVNPNDTRTLKEGIQQALELSNADQIIQMDAMRKTVRENDIHLWTSSFLDDMADRQEYRLLKNPQVMSFEERRDLIDHYVKATNRILFLDYDGTLVQFQPHPVDAVPSAELLDLLGQLTAQAENTVYLVSGRDAATLDKWFSGCGVHLIAEHGSMIRKKDGDWIYLGKNEFRWMLEVKELFDKYTERYPGTFSESKRFSLAFHYRAVDAASTPELKQCLMHDLLMLDHSSDFDILPGNMVLEVRPPDTNKGTTVRYILKENDFDFILAIGDDATDEDIFEVLDAKEDFSVKVGISPTAARCNLINPGNVVSLLEQLAMCKSARLLRQQ